jgi:hypothetical protein
MSDQTKTIKTRQERWDEISNRIAELCDELESIAEEGEMNEETELVLESLRNEVDNLLDIDIEASNEDDDI